MRSQEEDAGYFPRGRSMLRAVLEERVVGLHYGQRALCIGAINPLNFVGTHEHSAGRATPFKRLARTGNEFETIYFGTRAQADAVLGRVHRMHGRISGALSEAAGATPAGTPYAATDPALMLWTVAVMADSARHFYELLVRGLSERERDALWEEFVRFGELFGMPREIAPTSWAQFGEYWHAQLYSDRAHLTPAARAVGYHVAFEIPLPWHAQPAKRVHDLVMLFSLPERVRELYGLPISAVQRAAYPAALIAMRGGRRFAPRPVTRGRSGKFFDLVADTERRWIASGRTVPQFAESPSRAVSAA
jgi:uncharacterized protein (DUF2236 family)